MIHSTAGTHRSDPAYAQRQFLQSARLDPEIAANFAYLGHCYAATDSQRAIRCYQKALRYCRSNSACFCLISEFVRLSPVEPEAGPALCELYVRAGRVTDAVKVWQHVCAESTGAGVCWAWQQLASYYLVRLLLWIFSWWLSQDPVGTQGQRSYQWFSAGPEGTTSSPEGLEWSGYGLL